MEPLTIRGRHKAGYCEAMAQRFIARQNKQIQLGFTRGLGDEMEFESAIECGEGGGAQGGLFAKLNALDCSVIFVTVTSVGEVIFMNCSKIAAVALILISSSKVAIADNKYLSGNDLIEHCVLVDNQKGDLFQGGICMGYILGVSDAGGCKNPISGWKFDIPKGVSALQLEKTVVKWLNQNPDKLHHIGSKLVAFALSDNFPCK